MSDMKRGMRLSVPPSAYTGDVQALIGKVYPNFSLESFKRAYPINRALGIIHTRKTGSLKAYRILCVLYIQVSISLYK
jgi:hypothetical protein